MAPVPASDRDRRVMFAMDFRDPVTGLPVTADLDVAAEGLGPPIRPPSGLFVWTRGPGAPAKVRLTATSRTKQFADIDKMIPIPAENAPASSLRLVHVLTATGHYRPPEGLTGAAGWLVEDASRAPVAGARVALAFRHAGTQNFVSAYEAVTDAQGGFVAVANDMGDVRPDPAPSEAGGGILGWLVVTRPGRTKFSGLQPLRAGRLERFAEPILWAGLEATPP